MNTCDRCKDFKQISTTINNLIYGTCESEHGYYNLDDIQDGGFAVISIRPTNLAVTSTFGCIHFRKKEIKQSKLF